MTQTEAYVATSNQVEARAKIWFERDGKLVLSDWRVELLTAVGETGSLTRAADSLHVPYRTAWSKLKEIEEQLGIRLLETQSGGTGGGGSLLTPEARELIARFRRVRDGVGELVRERFEAEFSGRLG
jgi:molybdate transport system regulatory protein